MSTRLGAETGIALIVVLLAMIVLSTLGAALVLTTAADTRIAGNFRGAQQALHAADAGAARALDDLISIPDWNLLLGGTLLSSFVDGAPGGTRRLDDGSTIDLGQIASLANCEKRVACSNADMAATTADRPWGPNNPRWRLYAYGRLRDLLPADAPDMPYYLVVLVADDPAETDNDPARDAAAGTPGSGIVAVRAEAFGPQQAHKVVELTAARGDHAMRVLSWREVR